MRKIIQQFLPYITILLFMFFLIVPTIVYPFIKEYIDTENTENRELAQKPAMNLKNIVSYPEQYEAYFNDHLAFRKQFIKLYTYSNLKLFQSLDSERVVYGKDDWLFYNSSSDGDPITCYRGTNLMTENALAEYKERLILVRDRLKKYNKELVLFIAPNKEQVYSEYMPDRIEVVSDFSRSDQLVQYLTGNSDINVVYPFDELLQEKTKYQMYYKNDTHWNELGGFIGAQQLLEVINGNRKYLDEMDISQREEVIGDLAKMENLQEVLPKDKKTDIKNYYTEINVENVTKDRKDFRQYISDSENNQTILMLGDSFREAMEPYISKHFAKSDFYHFHDVNSEDITAPAADIIVIEVVERYVPSILPICDKLLEAYP